MSRLTRTILVALVTATCVAAGPRERVSFDAGWRFHHGTADDGPTYDAIRPWLLPAGNPFTAHASTRPATEPATPACAAPSFDDADWQAVDLPHDWAVAGPFTAAGNGGMGRLPTAGVGWYRRRFDVPDDGRRTVLEIDGAMSYAAVWVNGRLAGGWPYGYASWQLDLTAYVHPGPGNVVAVRLDNPPDSARWYPGAGLYRHVWLTRTDAVHVGQWGTSVTTPTVSADAGTVDVAVTVDNDTAADATVLVATDLTAAGQVVATLAPTDVTVTAAHAATVRSSATIAHPRLWAPWTDGSPDRYLAVTTVTRGGRIVDRYETSFGVRSVRWDADRGLLVNGRRVAIHGVNQHHDLGPLGAAFDAAAAERQLRILRDVGCNAIRTSHNPPAPELLDLTDRMGFLVLDEIFDCWDRRKTPNDFHAIFQDWHEPDLRAFLRRDRNHPSVVLWSVGNEVGEQMAGDAGAATARELVAIAHAEDPTRPVTASMNWARPDSPFAAAVDVVALNYQGEGVRKLPGQYDAFHAKFPGKAILSSETASALSTRGSYTFPVTAAASGPVRDGSGGDSQQHLVSDYGLYAADFGSSPDRVFAALDRHPFVAGEFVWSGFDYLGEPTPYDAARSSYSGIIDLAGFPKNRYHQYRARWRPDEPTAHLLPHWTWPDRVGQVTPVHLFTNGDEAELTLNGRSLGRRRVGPFEYRLRWDDVVYEPGTLTAIVYRNGQRWATDTVTTAGPPAKLGATVDGPGFVTVRVLDRDGHVCPRADNRLTFAVDGPGRLVAADNGDPRSLEPFAAPGHTAFNGLCLAVVRADRGASAPITLRVAADGLGPAAITLPPPTGTP